MPWYIHTLDRVYCKGVRAYVTQPKRKLIAGVEMTEGRWVAAVAVPYAANIVERIAAAWWVLTGKAHAFTWPKPGELERALEQ